MHLIVALLRDGHTVGAIDLDARQATLSGYLAARENFAAAKGLPLPGPKFVAVHRSELDSRAEADADEASRFEAAMADLSECEIIVIDRSAIAASKRLASSASAS